jgi:hypothetical protein
MRALLIGLSGLFGLWACTTGTRDRACDPVARTGCAADLRCVILADGAPACVASSGANRGEGQLCEADDMCGAGLGCVRLLGVARCLRLCATAARPDLCVAATVEPSEQEAAPDAPAAPFELRASARCLVALPDRPDLGACVLPCRLGVLEDCPEATTCTGSEVLGWSVCQPVPAEGAGALGAACGAGSLGCEVGLVCAALGDRRVCMAPAVAGCADDTVRMELPLAASTDDGAAPAVCAPCLAVPTSAGVFGACLGGHSPDAEPSCEAADPLACACAAFGAPAQLAGADVAEVAQAVAVAVELRGLVEQAFWVSARQVDGRWTWGDGAAVAATHWAAGEPGAGGCAALGPAGLVSQPCATLGAVLCGD